MSTMITMNASTAAPVARVPNEGSSEGVILCHHPKLCTECVGYGDECGRQSVCPVEAVSRTLISERKRSISPRLWDHPDQVPVEAISTRPPLLSEPKVAQRGRG